MKKDFIFTFVRPNGSTFQIEMKALDWDNAILCAIDYELEHFFADLRLISLELKNKSHANPLL